MAYSTLAVQADTPTAGPNAAYFQQLFDNFAALRIRGVGGVCYSNANQTITSGAAATLTYTTELFDDGGCVNLGTNNDRITVPTSQGGLWVFGAAVASTAGLGGSSAGFLGFDLAYTTTGPTTLVLGELITGTSSGAAAAPYIYGSLAVVWPLAAGDFITVTAQNTAASGADHTDTTKTYTTLWAFRLNA